MSWLHNPSYLDNVSIWGLGVSFFYFSAGVDEGDIIAQQAFNIEEGDSIKEVLEKAKSASLQVLKDYIPRIAMGTAPRLKQDHSKATVYPKRSPEDGLINWDWDLLRIKNFIRAQTKPYPGAFTYINGKKIILWDADISL